MSPFGVLYIPNATPPSALALFSQRRIRSDFICGVTC
jgi:hypothetical protein